MTLLLHLEKCKDGALVGFSPEKSFRRDLIWAWTSMPTTSSQPGHRESSLAALTACAWRTQ